MKVVDGLENRSTKIVVAKIEERRANLKMVKYPDSNGIIKACVSRNNPTRHLVIRNGGFAKQATISNKGKRKPLPVGISYRKNNGSTAHFGCIE